MPYRRYALAATKQFTSEVFTSDVPLADAMDDVTLELHNRLQREGLEQAYGQQLVAIDADVDPWDGKSALAPAPPVKAQIIELSIEERVAALESVTPTALSMERRIG